MRYLTANGADPNLTLDNKTTALMIAAGVGYREGRTRGEEAEAIEAIKLCISLGGEVNAVNDRGDTPLHGAANRGANDIVKFLAASGAKLELKNKQGLTPLEIAEGKGGQGGIRNPHDSTAALLMQLTKGPSAKRAE